MLIIYISGPYTIGNVLENVETAIAYGASIIRDGHCPVIPHLSHYVNQLHKFPYKKWIELDLVLLSKCNALYRIEGKSLGADTEVEFALKNNIPIFFDYSHLYTFMKEGK